MKSENPKPNKQPFDFLKLWSLTLPLILTVGVLGLLGHLLDDALDLNFPLFLLLGIFAGLGAAVLQILRTLNKK